MCVLTSAQLLQLCSMNNAKNQSRMWRAIALHWRLTGSHIPADTHIHIHIRVSTRAHLGTYTQIMARPNLCLLILCVWGWVCVCIYVSMGASRPAGQCELLCKLASMHCHCHSASRQGVWVTSKSDAAAEVKWQQRQLQLNEAYKCCCS